MRLGTLACVLTHLRLLLADFVGCLLFGFIFSPFFCIILLILALLFPLSLCIDISFYLLSIHKHIVCYLQFVVPLTYSIFAESQTTLCAILFGGLCSHVIVEYSVTLCFNGCVLYVLASASTPISQLALWNHTF